MTALGPASPSRVAPGEARRHPCQSKIFLFDQVVSARVAVRAGLADSPRLPSAPARKVGTMTSTRLLGSAFAVILGVAAVSGGPAAAADKGPPSCARINFRAMPAGQNDGEQEAGIYSSRFN